ncbi:MAG: DUF2510 domain-containing protein [Candidatus Nanopelagicales bacterium]
MSSVGLTERTNRIWAALQTHADAFDGQHSFLGSDLPPDQMQHAASAFLRLEPGERVLAFLDETLRKNGKGGIALTDRAIHTRQFGEGTHTQSLDAVRSVDVRAGFANEQLVINGRDLVTCTIAQNRPALEAIRDALVEALDLGASAVPAAQQTLPPPPVAVPAGWNPDPYGLHALRYWDGSAWTEHVSDHGDSSVDPLPDVDADPVVRVEATHFSAGPVSLVRKADGMWNYPQMCVVCSSPDLVGVVKYHGETGLNRTVSVDLAFPICSTCYAVAVQGGLKPDGSWGFGRAPKEIRPRIKEIKQAVKIKPTSATSWTLKIRFTFTNPQFAAAFGDLNP